MRYPDSYGRLPVAAAAFCLLLGAAAGAHAQAVARSFDELRLKVAPGDAIYVTDADGREQRARIVDFSPSTIVVDAGRGHRTFTERDVQRIRKRTPDSLWTGGLIGAAVGVAFGAAAVRFSDECHYRSTSCVAPVISSTLMAAGIGIGLDALIQGRKVVYEGAERRSSWVSVRPVFGPGKAGAVVVVRR